ncbi:MAG: hypothetical protein ACE37F_22995 [Nannocystaceae bacterium]|nr:hypothetical protein [bacterium]
MSSSVLLAHVGPIVWSLALGLPAVGLALGYHRRAGTREARSRRAVEAARVAIAAARVDVAWRNLDAALIPDASLSPEAAAVNRSVLHQVERLVDPDIATQVRQCLQPLEHAYTLVEGGGRGGGALARVSILQRLIASRGEARPDVLTALHDPADDTRDTIEVSPAAIAS